MIHIGTYSTQAVVPSDTIGPSVVFVCHFYHDSDAVGCLIKLVLTDSNDSVKFTGTGNRTNDNEATVTIDGVDIAGEYRVTIYEIEEDQSVVFVSRMFISISLLISPTSASNIYNMIPSTTALSTSSAAVSSRSSSSSGSSGSMISSGTPSESYMCLLTKFQAHFSPSNTFTIKCINFNSVFGG